MHTLMICKKTGSFCQTPGMCMPHGGCSTVSSDPLMVRVSLAEYLWLHANRKHGSAKGWAQHLGVSQGYVSQVLSGKKEPSERMLLDAGLKIERHILAVVSAA